MTPFASRVLRRFRRDDRGAELIEFAFSAIAFFIIVFATLEFGRMVWQYNVVASAAKDAVRYASVRGASATSPATSSDISSYVDTRVYGMSVTTTTTWIPDNTSGSVVQVKVQGSFRSVVGLLPQSTFTLKSTAQMYIIR